MDDFNIFKILNITNQEIKHSDVLAWLLDNTKNHNLSHAFLNELIFEIETFSNEELNLTIDDSYKVRREYKVDKGFIDIVLMSSSQKSIIIIENKIKAKESFNQLTKYKEYFQNKAPDYKLTLIFLTLFNDKANDEDYISISYIPIIKALDRISRYENSDLKIKLFIEDYLSILLEKYGLKSSHDLIDFRKVANIENKYRSNNVRKEN